MLTQTKLPAVRALESSEEFSETRLEAIGFIFHGAVPESNGKPRNARTPLESAALRSMQQAGKSRRERNKDLVQVGPGRYRASRRLDRNQRWKWCKICEREITQRILDES